MLALPLHKHADAVVGMLALLFVVRNLGMLRGHQGEAKGIRALASVACAGARHAISQAGVTPTQRHG